MYLQVEKSKMKNHYSYSPIIYPTAHTSPVSNDVITLYSQPSLLIVNVGNSDGSFINLSMNDVDASICVGVLNFDDAGTNSHADITLKPPCRNLLIEQTVQFLERATAQFQDTEEDKYGAEERERPPNEANSGPEGILLHSGSMERCN